MPDGRILRQLNGLRKDNTGYDIRHLLMGAEGTLGIITTACLKLFARPQSTLTVWMSTDGAQQAVDLLGSLLDQFDAQLTTFEWMQHDAVMLVHKHFGAQLPVNPSASYILAEITSPQTDAGLEEAFEPWAEQALKNQLLRDCAIAQSTEQAKNMWALRENLSEAQAREGLNVKHDLSLPVSSIPCFLESNLDRLTKRYPGIRPVVFGHLGDGNLHYNFSCPVGASSTEFLSLNESDINAAVLSDVQNFGGSISAEHGIGLLKRDILPCYKDAVALDVMRSIKRALDPQDLMNPGKVLTSKPA
jgi:FAD/FMN-containing dehydrogenase